MSSLSRSSPSESFRTLPPTTVSASTTSIPLVTIPAGCRSYELFNDSVYSLKINEGAAASAVNYVGSPVAPGGTLIVSGDDVTVGPIEGIWSGGPSGSVRITLRVRVK